LRLLGAPGRSSLLQYSSSSNLTTNIDHTVVIICRLRITARTPRSNKHRPCVVHLVMKKQTKQIRFAPHAQVCVVERLDKYCSRNVLSYSREEYDGFRRGIIKDVVVCRTRRRKGLPMDNVATETTFGIEQLLEERADGPKMVRSAHCSAILKAQEHAAKDELVCAEKFLRDVSLSCSTDSMVRARFIGIRQSRTT